jgi:septal ring factor EnvC (AmiA/AmiB activator)
MAKAATKPVAKSKKLPARKTAAKTAAKPAKLARKPRAPVISKDELRSQIEKLTASNATLKKKNRETVKALKAAEARITALEAESKPADTGDADTELEPETA